MHHRRLRIPAGHPAFDGHFPGCPIWPGALLLDEVLHALETELALDLRDWQVTSTKFPSITTSAFNAITDPTPWQGTFYPVPTDASLRTDIGLTPRVTGAGLAN